MFLSFFFFFFCLIWFVCLLFVYCLFLFLFCFVFCFLFVCFCFFVSEKEVLVKYKLCSNKCLFVCLFRREMFLLNINYAQVRVCLFVCLVCLFSLFVCCRGLIKYINCAKIIVFLSVCLFGW